MRVSYSQATVEAGDEPADTSDLAACFAGQRNGLCGAGEPGLLFLVTGLHTGSAPFVVEAHDAPPDVPDWEEVVEVSFPVPRSPVVLCGWAGGSSAPLDLAPDVYRVRYCATGMDAGKAADVRRAGEPEIDRYLLQFWPAPADQDRVLRQTGAVALYWHDYARSAPTPEQVRARRAEATKPRQRQIEHDRRIRERLLWRGARPPGPLGDVPSARTLVLLDRPLAEAIAAATPAQQKALARWAARRTMAEAGLESIDWIASGLSALDAAERLPAPFDDEQKAWQSLWADERVPRSVVTSPDEQSSACLQQAMAFPALAAAAHPDPAVAVFDALHHATAAFGAPGYQTLYGELQRTLSAQSDGIPS
ncbi:hypothetical protein ACFSF1_00270 [Pseudonocardia alaniniphila]